MLITDEQWDEVMFFAEHYLDYLEDSSDILNDIEADKTELLIKRYKNGDRSSGLYTELLILK
ncbi:hypothetical protein LCGC14_0888490 [marine sediment metagenome]|uniref:Uncharacterized protein n=1 Tax=marine sediment metagenome TaxID=412755 RepID=A0A0F9RJ69_9ZZZZ